jgi:hypothetical protein
VITIIRVIFAAERVEEMDMNRVTGALGHILETNAVTKDLFNVPILGATGREFL